MEFRKMPDGGLFFRLEQEDWKADWRTFIEAVKMNKCQYMPKNPVSFPKCLECGKVIFTDDCPFCGPCYDKLHQCSNPETFLRKSNVPAIFIEASFSNFKGDISGIYKAVTVDNDATIPNIVLTGITGSGKSRISCQILRHLVQMGQAWEKKFWFLPAYRFIYEMLDTMGKDGGKKLDIVDRYAGYDVLVIDDLGFDDDSKWATGQFYALIDMRILAGLPTIITTNIPPAEWGRDLGGRIESRLAGMEVFQLPFVDYRKKRG